MFPQCPIALRISAHLLLGVVRIYSKQVDYLYKDCNEIRITINRVFTTVNVSLPDDATHAQINSVTLPEKLDLDNLDLDDYYKDLGQDSHLKSQADITLTEQIPTGKDPYIIIHFNEQDLGASSLAEDDSGIAPTAMDEVVPPPVEFDTPVGLNDPSSNNQLGANGRNVGNGSPQNLTSVEIRRVAAHGFDFNNSAILFGRAAPDKFLEEQINNDKKNFTPATEETRSCDGHYLPSHSNHVEQHQSIGHLNSPMPLVHPSPEMEIQQSGHDAKPKVRRKRKDLFDEVAVLSNRHMKNMLNDTSDIRRVRRECPSSSLAIWNQNKRLRLRKEDVIFEPFINGTCANLQALYKEDLLYAKFQIASTKETHQETNAAQPPLSTHDSNIEIEILRNNKCPSPHRHISPLSTPAPSPAGKSNLTPKNSNLGLQSEPMETTRGDVGPSGNFDSEMQTPDTFYDKDLQAEHTALSDIPELLPSGGDLQFLEQDDNFLSGSQRTPETGIFSKNQVTSELQALSSRTRAVAQYLKRQSSVTPTLKNSDQHLSLDKILEGKPRKVCARMFFETLVLKTRGILDAHQKYPYADITLKLTPKGQFSF